MHIRCDTRTLAVLLAATLFAQPALRAQNAQESDHLDALLALSMEDLLGVSVSSVEGVARPWFTTPAAAYVITEADITASGHQHMAELLRMAPGVYVSQINSNDWNVMVRGSDSAYSNKLQVLRDGRVLFTPPFAGVWWHVQDYMLEDLQVVEVVRGPGTTLWGTNAVNGVVSFTTKPAEDTLGSLTVVEAGTHSAIFGTRYGAKAGDNLYYRVWVKHADRAGFKSPEGEAVPHFGPYSLYDLASDGKELPDDWSMTTAGFRTDWFAGRDLRLSVQGEGYYSDRLGGEAVYLREDPPPLQTGIPAVGLFEIHHEDGSAKGGFLQTTLTSGDEIDGWSLRLDGEHHYSAPRGGFQLELDIWDIDFRQHREVFEWNQLVWGIQARSVKSESRAGSRIGFNPDSRTQTVYSGFIQDSIEIIEDRLSIITGVKIENHDVSGTELQPTIRASWQPVRPLSIWAGVSRAVRTPSLYETDMLTRLVQFDLSEVEVLAPIAPSLPNPYPITLQGNQDLEPETLVAYEAGIRFQPHNSLIMGVSLFHFQYDDLIYIDAPLDDMEVLELVLLDQGVVSFRNGGRSESTGGEAFIKWQPVQGLTLDANMSRIEVDSDDNAARFAPFSPEFTAHLKGSYRITPTIEVSALGYYWKFQKNEAGVDDSHLRLDLGLSWSPNEHVKLSVWGQDLLDPGHVEGENAFTSAKWVNIERMVYFSAKISF